MPDDLWKMYSWWSLLQFTGAGDYPIYIYIIYIYIIYKNIYINIYIIYLLYLHLNRKKYRWEPKEKKSTGPRHRVPTISGTCKKSTQRKICKKKNQQDKHLEMFFSAKSFFGREKLVGICLLQESVCWLIPWNEILGTKKTVIVTVIAFQTNLKKQVFSIRSKGDFPNHS